MDFVANHVDKKSSGEIDFLKKKNCMIQIKYAY